MQDSIVCRGIDDLLFPLKNRNGTRASPLGPQEPTDGDEGKDVDLNAGIEVTYDDNEGELMWI